MRYMTFFRMYGMDPSVPSDVQTVKNMAKWLADGIKDFLKETEVRDTQVKYDRYSGDSVNPGYCIQLACKDDAEMQKLKVALDMPRMRPEGKHFCFRRVAFTYGDAGRTEASL